MSWSRKHVAAESCFVGGRVQCTTTTTCTSLAPFIVTLWNKLWGKFGPSLSRTGRPGFDIGLEPIWAGVCNLFRMPEITARLFLKDTVERVFLGFIVYGWTDGEGSRKHLSFMLNIVIDVTVHT